MEIRDASTNKSMEVTSEGRAKVLALSVPLGHHINHDHGDAYTINVSVTPTGAGDCFFYMKNLSETDIIIEKICLYVAADDIISLNISDTGTPVGGTDVTPVNCHAQEGRQAEGTFQYGVDITGLSGGKLLHRFFFNGGDTSKEFNFNNNIILPKNSTLTLWATTGNAVVMFTIPIFYHEAQ